MLHNSRSDSETRCHPGPCTLRTTERRWVGYDLVLIWFTAFASNLRFILLSVVKAHSALSQSIVYGLAPYLYYLQ